MALVKVDLHLLDGVQRLRAWVSGNPAHWQYRRISYGACTQGWFVERIQQAGGGAWLVPDERAACERIETLMARGGPWERVPARWDANGLPCDGADWFEYTPNTWRLGPPPEGHTGRFVTGEG